MEFDAKGKAGSEGTAQRTYGQIRMAERGVDSSHDQQVAAAQMRISECFELVDDLAGAGFVSDRGLEQTGDAEGFEIVERCLCGELLPCLEPLSSLTHLARLQK